MVSSVLQISCKSCLQVYSKPGHPHIDKHVLLRHEQGYQIFYWKNLILISCIAEMQSLKTYLCQQKEWRSKAISINVSELTYNLKIHNYKLNFLLVNENGIKVKIPQYCVASLVAKNKQKIFLLLSRPTKKGLSHWSQWHLCDKRIRTLTLIM